MISIYRWDRDRKSGTRVDPQVLREDPAGLQSEACVLWVDLEAPTEEEELLVLDQFFQVHPLTLLDITQRHRDPVVQGHLPKVEAFPNYLFVVVNPLRTEFMDRLRGGDYDPDDDGAVTQLSAVLTERMLITHHPQPSGAVRELHTFLAKHQEQAARGPDYLFHLLLDAMVDEFIPVLDHVQDELEGCEDRVFSRPDAETLQELLGLKRTTHYLRKTLVYEREVLARLIRGDLDLIAAQEMAYYRNVYDHVVRSNELVENAREMVSDLMQIHLAATSNRLNEVMKVLALISTVILPMTLISGIYGMNFEHMPELKWVWGYPMALGAMALTATAGVMLFRWRKWI